MHIKNNMLHSEVRKIGVMVRTLLPYFKVSTFKLCNKVQVLIKGKSSNSMAYEELYIPRTSDSMIKTPLRLCIYRPLNQTESAPGVLWIHGGGYAIGTPEQDERFIKQFVLEHGCTVISPDYCLSTTAPYPAALEDCYLALLWMKNHSLDYNIRPNQLVVAGDSAGGGLTAALTIYARDKKEVAICYQMPLYPMLDDRMITPSSQNNDAPVWNTKSNINGWKLYLGDLYHTDKVPAYAAPARLTDYTQLPPAFTFVGSVDPFLDETIRYMENLKAAFKYL